ncbi:beta-parvin-like isoform X1 [Anneissia japonica]|uniref:beta-parvin-like isoform X1 n=2 Tax=Anneissia japonica TaxID=1529436 RepID=UPI001425B5F7|nr:beta-parvin-like isoform X1 [Anneissia japonica]
MATSPTTRATTPKRDKKDDSFLNIVTTLGRRKKEKDNKEVDDLAEEGRYALESPGMLLDFSTENLVLDEGQEISMIENSSRESAKLKELVEVLIDWINVELKDQRIIVRDLEEDLHDGQILGNLYEKLTGNKFEVREVMQSTVFQKQKLQMVLEAVEKLSGNQKQQKWSVDSIHSKNLISILHLLVSLAFHFKAPIKIPEDVSVSVVVIQKKDNVLVSKRVSETITKANEAIGGNFERDAFDTLFSHAPDKLIIVRKSLVTFANKHLNKINLDVTDLEEQFHDGVYFILLMGLLEGYFVPMYSYHMTPETFEQKVHNVALSLELMEDAGLSRPKARPEDIVHKDLKSTVRVMYNLFIKYKAIH